MRSVVFFLLIWLLDVEFFQYILYLLEIGFPDTRVDRTKDIYANFLHSSGQFFKLRQRNPNVELDFLIMFCIWVLLWRSSDNVIPR